MLSCLLAHLPCHAGCAASLLARPPLWSLLRALASRQTSGDGLASLGSVALDLIEHRLGPCRKLWRGLLLLNPLLDVLPNGIGHRQLAELSDHAELSVHAIIEYRAF